MRLARGASGQVDRVPDPAGRHADLAAQLVRLGVAQPAGDVVDLAEQQPVQSPPGAQVQGVADVEQPLVRLA